MHSKHSNKLHKKVAVFILAGMADRPRNDISCCVTKRKKKGSIYQIKHIIIKFRNHRFFCNEKRNLLLL